MKVKKGANKMNLIEQELENELSEYDMWSNDIDSNEFFNVIIPALEFNLFGNDNL